MPDLGIKGHSSDSKVWQLTHSDPNINHSRGFPEEVVLAEDGDEEANETFDCHGNKSSSHNVPLKRRLHFMKLA